jgi:CRISPR-associated endonuclease/helicase Cas3
MFYANTQQQCLAQHSFAIGELAKNIVLQVTHHQADTTLLNTAYIAGCLHDIGKIDKSFQEWVIKPASKKVLIEDGVHIDKGKFSFENYPRHNELSLLLYSGLRNPKDKSPNTTSLTFIEHLIYWHHAKPFRENPYETLNNIYVDLLKKQGKDYLDTLAVQAQQLINDINTLASKYQQEANQPFKINSFLNPASQAAWVTIKNNPLPVYKHYIEQVELSDYQGDIKLNAKKALLRAAVISADRLISALSAQKLEELINTQNIASLLPKTISSNLQNDIEILLKGFPDSEQSTIQSQAANQLANIDSIAILQGAAGCGKTKIALEWAAKKAVKQIIWVCPRVQVCQSLYHDLTQADYLINAQVEIHTGEIKSIKHQGKEVPTDENTFFSGDVVITTIDQMINSITTHTKATALIEMMQTHVVFDEYHEYIQMAGFNLLFAELIQCQCFKGNQENTLLVSATPNYLFLKQILGIDDLNIIKVPSFNSRTYQINLQPYNEDSLENNPFYATQPTSSFVISNTATTAQLSYIYNESNEKSLLIHSKLKASDKELLFKQVLHSFGRNFLQNYDVLRSGPIIQASLNISCQNMVAELSHAENSLQRLGRLDRFGENEAINIYTLAIPSSIENKQDYKGSARFLESLHSLKSAIAWQQFLQKNLSKQPLTINEIYQIYEKFYQDEAAIMAITTDLLSALEQSVKLLKAKVYDPIRVSTKTHKTAQKIKIKKNSLRGNNYFVQMTVCKVKQGKVYETAKKYAYDENIDNQNNDNLTLSIELITAYNSDDKSPLEFMKSKHHNIKQGAERARNSGILLGMARSPETPIYLSYTQSDLDKNQVAEKNFAHAIYYVESDKQAIGIMPSKHLIF